MDRTGTIELIEESRVIAIIRAKTADRVMDATAAIMAGGIRVVEVTMTTSGSLEVISEATDYFGDAVLFGAGTVLDTDTARSAIAAGAGFIVAPNVDQNVIRLCNQLGVPAIPGAFTPTEAQAAWKAGADMIKLFPASLGGPSLVKAILSPLPHLKIVPVGGVDLGTARSYLESGAVAIGVGSTLVDQALLDSGDMVELTRRAAAFVAETRR